MVFASVNAGRVHRQDGGKADLHAPFTEDGLRCVMHALPGLSVCITMDREHAGCNWSRARRMLTADRVVHDGRGVLNPLTIRWRESLALGQQGSLGLQARRVLEQGRMKSAVTVNEQIAQALRVKEQAEQTLRVSVAFKQVSPTEHHKRLNLGPMNTC